MKEKWLRLLILASVIIPVTVLAGLYVVRLIKTRPDANKTKNDEGAPCNFYEDLTCPPGPSGPHTQFELADWTLTGIQLSNLKNSCCDSLTYRRIYHPEFGAYAEIVVCDRGSKKRIEIMVYVDAHGKETLQTVTVRDLKTGIRDVYHPVLDKRIQDKDPDALEHMPRLERDAHAILDCARRYFTERENQLKDIAKK